MLALGFLLTGAPAALARKPHAAVPPRSGGNITDRVVGSPDCLDPAKSVFGYGYMYPVNDGLLTVNDKGKPVPYIAQKYTVSNGGKTLTFDLRHDVKYSNGHPLVAADLKAELERSIDPATKSPFAKNLLASVASIDTSGKYVLTLHLSAPDRPLLYNLAGPFLGFVDPKSVAAAGSNSCNGLVGSGPFKFASVGPAYSTVKEVRNPRYTVAPGWAHNKGQPYLSSITFNVITSDATVVSELLSGQVDISDISGSELSRVQGNPNIKLHRILVQGENFLEFNVTRPPFNNVAVRRAVAEAINRKSLITAAVQGLGKESTSILSPTVFGYDPKSPSYAPKLNLSAARAAIAAAHATGPYTLVAPQQLGADTAAELIQGELAQVGMQVNVVNKPPADWYSQIAKGDFDMTIITYGYADPDFLYTLFHSSQRNGGYNFGGIDDPALDKLLVAGQRTLNLKKARADYYAAQKILDTKVYAEPLWVSIDVTGVRSRVQGWHTDLGGSILWQDLWVK
jgi:peptide/nickel transport system substrate-binding protein